MYRITVTINEWERYKLFFPPMDGYPLGNKSIIIIGIHISIKKPEHKRKELS